jgi:hypothetical protein
MADVVTVAGTVNGQDQTISVTGNAVMVNEAIVTSTEKRGVNGYPAAHDQPGWAAFREAGPGSRVKGA